MTLQQRIVLASAALLTFSFGLTALLNYWWMPDFSVASLALEAIPLAAFLVVGTVMFLLWRPLSLPADNAVAKPVKHPVARLATATDRG